MSNGIWLTPNEFEESAGAGESRNYLRTIKHHDQPLKTLVESGKLVSMIPGMAILVLAKN